MDTKRMQFIDNTRTLLIGLVILVHTAVTYGGEGGWYYEESTGNIVVVVLLTMFNAINQSFFMSLLFLFAGYFTSMSLVGAKTAKFTSGRLIRLGLPLLFFYLVLSPLTIYIAYALEGLDGFNYGSALQSGPMWFAQALLIFTFLFLAFRAIAPKIASKWHTRAPQSPSLARKRIILFTLLLFICTVPARHYWPMGYGIAGMQLGSFGHYLLMYGLGTYLYYQDWESFLDSVSLSTVQIFAALGILVLPIGMALGVDDELGFEYFMGGLSWQALFYDAWESVMCVAMSLLVTIHVRNWTKDDSSLLRKMGRANYAVYIIHPPVLLFFSYLLIGPIPPLLKFVIAGSATIIICFPIAYFLTRLPGLRKVI
jgi:peptidoglycan/LPS O-acetylase OafA/YrhL